MENILDLKNNGENIVATQTKSIGEIIRNDFDNTTLKNLGEAHHIANKTIYDTHNNIELIINNIIQLITKLKNSIHDNEKIIDIINKIENELDKIYENNLIGYETYCNIETLTIEELGRLGLKLKEAKFDKDTGLKTKNYFKDEFEIFFKEKREFSLILLDLNNLKQINDNYGHKKGDKLLEEFAIGLNDEQIFRGIENQIDGQIIDIKGLDYQLIDSNNQIYRIGGDEFAIIFFGDENEIDNIIDKLRKWFYKRKLKFRYNGETIEHEITFGIGITKTDYNNFKTSDDLFEETDKRLYKDKIREKIRDILKIHNNPKKIIDYLETIKNKKIEYQNKIFDILFISLKRIEQALLNLYIKKEKLIKETDEEYKKELKLNKTKAKNYLEEQLKLYTLENIDKIIKEKRIDKVLKKFGEVKEEE